MITLYNLVSSNGYITERNGSEDFIPDGAWEEFIEICKQNDVLVMGKNTYKTLQKYDHRLLVQLEDLKIKKLVVSTDIGFAPKNDYIKVASPKEVLGFGDNILLSSGPSLNTSFLKEGLIDTIILNTLPLTIEGGLKVFEENTSPTLELISRKDMGQSREMCTYKLAKNQNSKP